MKQSIRDSKFLLPAICCLFLIVGYSLSIIWQPKNIQTEISKSKHQSGYTYISPLLECADNDSNLSQTTELEKKMRTFIDKEKEGQILETIKNVGTNALKAIKEDLPDEYSYDDIKLVLVKNGL